jgi:hypothetical protein
MKRSLYIALCSGCILASGAAAQDPLELKCVTHYLDLDVPGGRYSTWQLRTVPERGIVSATLQFLELRRTSRWAPAFGIFVSGADWSRGLQFSTQRNWPLTARLVGDSGVTLSEFAIQVRRADSIAVEINFLSGDSLLVAVGNERPRIMDLPGSVSQIAVTSSSGEVKAHRVAVCNP